MRCRRFPVWLLVVSLAAWMAPAGLAQATRQASDAPPLTRSQMRDFLLHARIVKSRDIGKGVTRPLRLTLSDGRLTHDAAFQSIDERSAMANLQGRGGAAAAEINFVDAYRYNLAAEAVATLLGIEYMMPVHVERRWNARIGSLSWWVDTLMDEGERLKSKIDPPYPQAWNNQMFRMRVFSALVRDTDRNLTNVLITPDWRIVMIDFTRAFRLQSQLPNVADLPRCDRALFAALKTLEAGPLKAAARDSLTGGEIEAILKRRDLLVAHFTTLIAQKGEENVLY